MATAKKTPTPKTDPITVSVDIPDADPLPTSEPSMEDFAKAAASTIPSRKPASNRKRATVQEELDRLRVELDRNVSIVAVAICMRDAWDGQLILMNKDMLIDSWLEVAKVNPKFRQALLKLMDVGVYATAISNSLALAIAVLAHHRMTPNPDMMLTAVGYTGLQMPSDEAVEQMEQMFHAFTADEPETVNNNGSGS